jgi:hypothetical protein
MEVLGEEEYEGISELRSRERGALSGVSVIRRRKTPKNSDQEQRRQKLKSLKALKKQKAARTAVHKGATTSGATQGAAAGSVASPSTALGKIVSASRGGPSKTLDIFQAKIDDDTSGEDADG